MLRQIASRLLAQPGQRTLSASNNLLISNQRPPRPPRSYSSSFPKSPSSLAEPPPPVPESISSPPPLSEPTVNNAADPTSPVQPGSSSGLEPPLTPPPLTKLDLSKLPSLDIDAAALPEPESQGGERRRTGAGRKEYVSSIERQRRAYLRYGLGAMVLGGLWAVYYSGRSDDPNVSSPFCQGGMKLSGVGASGGRRHGTSGEG